VIVRRGVDYISESGEVYFADPNKGNDTTNKGCYNEDVPPSERPDVILFATGYRYHYPFLLPSSSSSSSSSSSKNNYVTTDGYKMQRLYKRILYINDTSLAFIGITNKNLSTAIHFEYQAKWYATMVVQRNCQTLNYADMEQEVLSRSDDVTQDDLLLKYKGYCDSLAGDVGATCFWSQIIFHRLPLCLKTMFAQSHSLLFWLVGISVVMYLSFCMNQIQMK